MEFGADFIRLSCHVAFSTAVRLICLVVVSHGRIWGEITSPDVIIIIFRFEKSHEFRQRTRRETAHVWHGSIIPERTRP